MKKIKVGHQVFDFKVCNTLSGRYGETNFTEKYIAINNDLVKNPSEFIATLIHEITHTIAWHMGHTIDDETVTQEKWCDLMGNGFTMVFLDNPELLPYIQSRVNPPDNFNDAKITLYGEL